MLQRRVAAIDPLWQCLCPGVLQHDIDRTLQLFRRLRQPRRSILKTQCSRNYASAHQGATDRVYTNVVSARRLWRTPAEGKVREELRCEDLQTEDTPSLYGLLGAAAVDANVPQCRMLAEYLVQERREKPNISIYNALILSNVHHRFGAAWRVAELLEELQALNLQLDGGTCHAILKVLAIHPDHLLRTGVLEHMRKRWFTLSEEGAHDVVAGLLREGLFEQALQRLDDMQGRMSIDAWLWDMAIYTLCAAGEVDEAYRIMQLRFDSGELNMSRSVWAYLLDKASELRHHHATSLTWTSQVNQGYINPPSGTCLAVLATAAQAGDAALGTEVFAHLSKRGAAYLPVHYELLIATYLSAQPPDIRRAMSILTIMPLEKLEPTVAETRSLFLSLRNDPDALRESFKLLRELHEQGRKIPIAALNLLIECHIEQGDLNEAMKIYKLIHTFVPINKGAQKSYANVDTFNLLLKGCRRSNPPDEQQASFLVSELLALRVVPTALTYDRLILVFVESAKVAWQNSIHADNSHEAEQHKGKAVELLDWALRHFTDMQPLGWMPRLGTLELLAVQLANARDERCWDVLQIIDDHGPSKIEGFAAKGKWVRGNVQRAWSMHQTTEQGVDGSE